MHSQLAWKRNWDETKQHFLDWWQQDGLVINTGDGFAAPEAHERIEAPGYEPEGYGDEAYCSDPDLRAQVECYRLSRQQFPCDMMPLAGIDLGPGTLSIYLGATPVFEGTVWYEPWMTDEDPSEYGALRFDPAHRWWQITEASAQASVALARGKYIVGFPDLIENIDTLAAVRGTEAFLTDLCDRPAWVEQKVAEINEAWFEVYQRLYDIIKLEDDSSAFGAFSIWGPGKTAKLQSDASAMISSGMFDRFVTPAITAQCEWLDHSMFHLDGSQCLCHVDSLLDIEALDAIEWTPDPGVPGGGDACWYDLYRRILDAGKSVQAVGVKADQVLPLLEAVGGKGLYILRVTGITDLADVEKLMRVVEPYR